MGAIASHVHKVRRLLTNMLMPNAINKIGIQMQNRIEVNPKIHFGKPCVAGTRIPVLDVLELVGEGISFADIIKDYYPDISHEDIQACIRYAIEVVDAEDIHLTVSA
jgi:uncharacterized protein (DUF433 family)